MPPDAGSVDEWFRVAHRDLDAARVLAGADEVDPIVAVAQLQQAIEKALKGFLLFHGWELVKTHDLGFLHAEALDHDGELAGYEGLCEIATKAYLEERYPGAGGIELTSEDARGLVDEGRKLSETERDRPLGGEPPVRLTARLARSARKESPRGIPTQRDTASRRPGRSRDGRT